MKLLSKTQAYKLASAKTRIIGYGNNWQIIAPHSADNINGATSLHGSFFYYRDAVKARKKVVAVLAVQLMTDCDVRIEADTESHCIDDYGMTSKELLVGLIAALGSSHPDFTY